MIDKVIENNRVSIIGEIVSEFKFSHEVFGEGFYTVDVSVRVPVGSQISREYTQTF